MHQTPPLRGSVSRVKGAHGAMMGSPASGRTGLCSEDINHDEDAAD